MVGWALAGSMVLGRRYFYLIAFTLAFLNAGSFQVAVNSAFTFFRNIEFPLMLLSVILFWKIIEGAAKRTRQRQWQLVTYYVVLTGILMVSDPYTIYALTPAILVTLAYRSVTKYPKFNWQISSAILAVLPVILSKITLRLLMSMHVFQFYGAPLNQPFHNLSDIPASAWAEVADLMNLFNSSGEFGQTIRLADMNGVFMGVIMILSLCAFYSTLKRVKSYTKTNPAFATLLISSAFLLVMYIVVAGFEHQSRFIIFPILVMVCSLAVWIHPTISKLSRRQFQSLYILLFVIVVCLLPLSYIQVHDSPEALPEAQTNRAAAALIARTIEAHGVNTIVSSYTYTSDVQFASGGKFHVATLLNCNENMPFVSLLSWYKVRPDTSKDVALIVDKNGRDQYSWLCTLKSVLNYYGKPVSETTLPGFDKSTIRVYYYPKSIIGKIKIITTAGKQVPDLPE